MATSFETRIDRYIERVCDCLERALPPKGTAPERLHEAMRYAVLNGGKRIRPLLVYATGECMDVAADSLDAPAVAIELIHAFSLVHDDLPAMDNDELRRGQPTVHVKFGEATAILAADALQPLAFSVLANAEYLTDSQIVAITSVISRACGSLGMTGGQSIDLAAEGNLLSAEELEIMHRLKTGALIQASVMSACCVSDGVSDAECTALRAFSESVGLAFQIRDDILDVIGSTEELGKQAGADQHRCKATWPAKFGIEGSQHRCNELLERGLQQLETFGAAADPLRWLANYIVDRGR